MARVTGKKTNMERDGGTGEGITTERVRGERGP